LALVSAFVILGIGLLLMVGSEQQAARVAGELADPSTFAFRLQVWDIANRLIADFPYTGVGMGAFNNAAVRLYPFSEVANPGAHNLYFQVAVDLGIPGLIAFISILLLALYMGVSSLNQLKLDGDGTIRALAAGLLGGIAALLAHGLIDITVWGTRVVFLPWAIIALVTAVYLHVKSQQQQ
jgi:putative inorganic carbon (HCO3(-)) transporter